MALEVRKLSVSSIKRFPRDVREELNKLLHRGSWQCLTREFGVDVFTGLTAKALDGIADLVDSSYPEFRNDVKKRLKLLKNSIRGKTQSFRGKSKVGLHSYFYRFWLVGQHNAEGLYDVVFCHIGRQEEFDFFLFLTKVMNGVAYTLVAAPQIVRQLLDRIPQWLVPYLEEGNIIEEDEEPIAGPNERGSPYTDLTQDLGDRLTEYELVEDLIERGTLAENTDGTLYIRLE